MKNIKNKQGKNFGKKKLENITTLIEVYFILPKGHIIDQPFDKLPIDIGTRISRRALKHIVEARKEDAYSIERILDMFVKIPETIREPDLIMPNWNKTYPKSFISAKLYPEIREALLVIQDKNGEIIDVINAFFRSREKFEKLQATSQ